MPPTITRRLVLAICRVYLKKGNAWVPQPARAARCRLGRHGGVHTEQWMGDTGSWLRVPKLHDFVQSASKCL